MAGPSLFIRQQVPIATVNNDGLMSANQAAQLANGQTAVEIYINSATGSDSNPGTQTSPLQNLQTAWDKLPANVTGKCRIIDICPGGGTYQLFNQDYYAPLPVANGTPLVIEGVQVDVLGGTKIAGVGTTGATVVLPVTTTDHNPALFGTVMIDQNSGEACSVIDNTFSAGNTTFTLNQPFFGSAPGDAVNLYKPGTSILLDAFDVAAFPKTTIGFTWIKFGSLAEPGFGLPTLAFPLEATAVLFGCWYDGGTSDRIIEVTHTGTIWCQARPEFWFADGDDNPMASPANLFGYLGAGMYLTSEGANGTALSGFDRAGLVGSVLMKNGQVGIDQASSATLDTICGTGVDVIASDNSIFTLGGGLINGSLHNNGIVTASSGSSLNLGGGNGLVLENGTVSGVEVDALSDATLGAITGTNTTYGIVVAAGANVVTSHGNTLVTGATNNLLVGGTAKAYGALPFFNTAALASAQ